MSQDDIATMASLMSALPEQGAELPTAPPQEVATEGEGAELGWEGSQGSSDDGGDDGALGYVHYDLANMDEATLATLLGTSEISSIDVSHECIASIVGAYIKNGLKVHNVYEQDLTIVLPVEVEWENTEYLRESSEIEGRAICMDPLQLGPMSKWITWGNKLFDVVYYFASDHKERVPITVYGDNDDGTALECNTDGVVCVTSAIASSDETLVEEAEEYRLPLTLQRLLCYYLWLMVRGGVQLATDTQPDQPIPAFMANSIGMTEGITPTVRGLASFAMAKVDPRWIKYVPLGEAATLIINRLSLGVAGYRMLRPFMVYPNRPRVEYTTAERNAIATRINNANPASVLGQVPLYRESLADYTARSNAYTIARAFATMPLDWAVHSATRQAWVITLMGGLNKPLQNLMLKCFTPAELTAMASPAQKLLYSVPVAHPGADSWRSWNIDLVNNLVDPILPVDAEHEAMGGGAQAGGGGHQGGGGHGPGSGGPDQGGSGGPGEGKQPPAAGEGEMSAAAAAEALASVTPAPSVPAEPKVATYAAVAKKPTAKTDKTQDQGKLVLAPSKGNRRKSSRGKGRIEAADVAMSAQK